MVSIHSSSDVVCIHSSVPSPGGFKDDVVSVHSSAPSRSPSEAYESCTSDLDRDDNAMDYNDSNKVEDYTGSHSKSTDATLRPRSLRIVSRLSKKKQQFSPQNTFLEHILLKKRLLNLSETLEKAKARWTPHLKLHKLTPSIIDLYRNDWSFVHHYRLTKTITLRCEIVAKRKPLKTGKELCLITWFPNGILEDSWVERSMIPVNGIKIVDTQKLSWEEKKRLVKILEMRDDANH